VGALDQLMEHDIHLGCLGEDHVPWIDQSLHSPHGKSSIVYSYQMHVFKVDIIYFQDFYEEYDKYALASSYFDLKEYDRAVYFLQDCNSSKNYFLHMYGRYLADEKRKVDNASSLTSLLSAPEREVTSPSDFKVVGALDQLMEHDIHLGCLGEDHVPWIVFSTRLQQF
jgi:hypothetical protein